MHLGFGLGVKKEKEKMIPLLNKRLRNWRK